MRAPSGGAGLVSVPDAWTGKPGARLLEQLLPGLTVEGELVETTQLGDEVVRFTVQAPRDGQAGFSFPSPADEHLVGMGEQFVTLAQRGRTVLGAIVDVAGARATAGPRVTYFHSPLLYMSGGRTLLVNTCEMYEADLADSDPERISWTAPGESLEAYVIAGAPKRAVEIVTLLTGRPRRPPPWVYGVWKTGVSGQQAVLAQAQRLRDEDIPCSGIWVYDHYDEPTNSGCNASGPYPRGSYGDLPGLATALHELGFAFLSYLSPCVYVDTAPYLEAEKRGFLVTDEEGQPYRFTWFHPSHEWFAQAEPTLTEDAAALVDFSNPDAATWWKSMLVDLMATQHVDGWMEDFGEAVHPDMRFSDGRDGNAWRNSYASLFHETGRAAIDETKPDAFFFCRSGYLGTQAHAPAVWPGDQVCDWSHEQGIRSLIPAGVSIGLSGVATWGALIAGVTEGSDLGGQDEELWIRWAQLSALTPMMYDCLAFKFDSAAAGGLVDLWSSERTIAAFRDAARLHVRLFPYLYSLATDAARSGVPIMRPLLLEYPEDPQTWTLDDQFLLGEDLLAAPVLEKGARSRQVYVPAGRWIDWATGDPHDGPAWVEVEAPLERPVVLQRGGGVVPLLAKVPPTLFGAGAGQGEYDLLLRVVGDGATERRLHDGSVVICAAGHVSVASPRPRRVAVERWRDGGWDRLSSRVGEHCLFALSDT